MQNRWWWVVVVLTTASWAQAQTGRTEPLGGGQSGLGGVTYLALPGIDGTATAAGEALEVRFKKPGAERRLLAFEARPGRDLSWVKALSLRYRLTGVPAGAARLAAVVQTAGGGAFFKVAAMPAVVGAETEGRVPLHNLREAAFSVEGAKLAWDKIERVWFGLAIDAACEGSFTMLKAAVTSEPYRPTAPLTVPLGKPEAWSVGKEPSVQHKVSLTNEGPDGTPAIRLDLTFPAGKHCWFIPGLTVTAPEIDGYRALRFRYKATLPTGPNLLFALAERDGGQYIIDPPVAQSADWKVLEQPLAQFKLAGWSRDPNNHLDLESGISIQTGCHGVANPGGSGSIWIAELTFVP